MLAPGPRRRAVRRAGAAQALAALAALAAALAILGWAADVPLLAAGAPGRVPVGPLPMALLALAAASVAAAHPWARPVRLAAGTAAIAVGLAAGRWPLAQPAEAGVLVLAGGAVLLRALRPARDAVLWPAAFAVALAAAALGYLATPAAFLDAGWPVPLPLAWTAALLGAAEALAAAPRWVDTDEAGARLARRGVPALLAAVPALAVAGAVSGLAAVPAWLPGAAGFAVGVAVGATAWLVDRRAAAQAVHLAADVAEHALEGVLGFAPDGRVLHANAAALQMFERNADTLLESPVWALFAPRDADRVREGLARFLAAGDQGVVGRTLLLRGRRAGGEEFPAEVSFASWSGPMGPMFAAVARDMSRRQLVEEALREARKGAEAAAQAKAAFLANMSHEIRTPMNAILGTVDTLAHTRLDADQVEQLGTIRNAGEHLLRLVNDILDYSKIESGRLELEAIPVDVRRLAEECIDIVAQQARGKGLELGYEVAPGVPPAIAGDPVRLRQVLINLLSNAVKFTARGRVRIRVEARKVGEPSRHELAFAVEDTGIGIPADAMPRLFQTFSQVDASTTRTHGGTGLGLAIVKRLAELMGGRVDVRSKPGEGSTFTVTLTADEAPVPVREPAGAVEGRLPGRRVLLVASDAAERHRLRTQCERWGLRVRDAADAATAAGWLRAGEAFDAALVAHSPPDLDAPAATAAIREALGGTRLPVVSIGADADGARMVSRPAQGSALFDAFASALGEAVAPAPAAPAATARQGLRLLLAEDNPVNQAVAVRMLRRLGCEPDLANDGEEAVAAATKAFAQGKPYDIILMDLQMPRLDGLEATGRIRAAMGKASRIVAMTADAMPGDRERCLAAGMDDYLPKPVRLDALARVVAAPEAKP